MICTVCGKPHTKEAPLTIAHKNEWLCPDCLKELDTSSKRLYGKSPLDDYVSESGIVFPGMAGKMGAGKSVISGYGGTIRIGNIELPIESFELK
jgi:hypothetical protein